MSKKLLISTVLLLTLPLSVYQSSSAQGVNVKLKCAISLVDKQEIGNFRCVKKFNSTEWQISSGHTEFSNWSLQKENTLKYRLAIPENVCLTSSEDFDRCISKQKGKFILLIGDSQIQSGVNILSFTGTKKPIIVSYLPGCPPLRFGSIKDESIYGEKCLSGNNDRISDDLYKRISSVMIMTAGRYTPFDLDQYLKLLKEYKIKNTIFIGPYVRSETNFADYILKFKTEEEIESNYEYSSVPKNKAYSENSNEINPMFDASNPSSNTFNPNFFDNVSKKHKMIFINPLKDFCELKCPVFLSGWPALTDTHHWSLNLVAQIYYKNHNLINGWLAKA